MTTQENKKPDEITNLAARLRRAETHYGETLATLEEAKAAHALAREELNEAQHLFDIEVARLRSLGPEDTSWGKTNAGKKTVKVRSKDAEDDDVVPTSRDAIIGLGGHKDAG